MGRPITSGRWTGAIYCRLGSRSWWRVLRRMSRWVADGMNRDWKADWLMRCRCHGTKSETGMSGMKSVRRRREKLGRESSLLKFMRMLIRAGWENEHCRKLKPKVLCTRDHSTWQHKFCTMNKSAIARYVSCVTDWSSLTRYQIMSPRRTKHCRTTQLGTPRKVSILWRLNLDRCQSCFSVHTCWL